MLQEVVHLPGSFNLGSQSQIMDKDVKVELVNHYGLNVYNRHGKLITTASQVDGRFGLDRAPELAEYTDNHNSFLLVLPTTEHASRHDAEKWMSWPRLLARVGLKAMHMLRTITDDQKMTGKCHRESGMKCKLA
jgi:hypothetical protein